MSDTGTSPISAPDASKTRSRTLAGSPAASTRPKFVRYAADCATCWSDSTLPLPMNCENGMAGMNWPKVPWDVTLYVRLDAMLASRLVGTALKRLEDELDVSGRISSMPVELPLDAVP